jgi:ParB-like chromosome segregation protein Spo0J
MLIELRSIESIKPYANNPRLNEAAVEAVAKSIQEFGFRQPIVIDAQGTIIVGHTRYKAALKLGLTHVPVHVAHELTPEQAQAYRIADNQTASIATWDDDKLIQELLALKSSDFDLSLTGFADEEITRLLNVEPDLIGDPDDIPEPPDEAITQPRDLWLFDPYFECDTCHKTFAYEQGLARNGVCHCG